MRGSLQILCFAAISCALVSPNRASGEERDGTIAGVVKDSSGSTLQGALAQLSPDVARQSHYQPAEYQHRRRRWPSA